MTRLKMIARVAIICWTGAGVFRYAVEAIPRFGSNTQEIDQGVPIRSIGIASTVLGTMSLKEYRDVLRNGELRVREVVLQPGARIAVHSHDSRPAVAYVLEGEVVEHLSDSEDAVIRRQGDVYFEGPEATHWLENISPNRVRVLAVDIVSNDPEHLAEEKAPAGSARR